VALRRSGLLTARAGELVFLHHTVQEYLAACHATRDASARAQTCQDLFGDTASPVWNFRSWPGMGMHRGSGRSRPLDPDVSHSGFVVDLLGDDAAAPLGRLVKQRKQRKFVGCQFIAALARLGTRLPDATIRAATDALAGMVHDLGLLDALRLRAAATLAELGDNERAADAFDELARDVILYHSDRVEAAADPLAELIRNDTPGDPLETALMDHERRVTAARALAGLGDLRGSDKLAEMADDHTVDQYARQAAVDALAELPHLNQDHLGQWTERGR